MNRRTLLALLVCALLAPAMSFAQPADNGGNGGGNNNGGGGGGGGNGQDWRQQWMDNLKQQLNAKDDEWKVIQPKVEKVAELRRASFSGFGRGMGGFRGNRNRGGGGGNNGGAQQNDSPLAQAMQDLRDTLDKKDASADDIAKKLQTLRDARDKSRKDMADAQKDLKDILTARQEAVMVVNGMLD